MDNSKQLVPRMFHGRERGTAAATMSPDGTRTEVKTRNTNQIPTASPKRSLLSRGTNGTADGLVAILSTKPSAVPTLCGAATE